MEIDNTSDDDVRTEFKMPVLIGKIGKLPKKALDIKKKSEEINEKLKLNNENLTSSNSLPPAVLLKEMSTPIPYKEPKWSGLCPDGSDYALEILKSGVIMERIELTNKPYYIFGRLVNCDIVMAHPTISRHHCVLQYKAFAEEGEPHSGWYLYDLGSTHGTYLNKEKIKPNHYTRVKVGHQIKFGTSTRTYILLGPEFDSEGESELTVTEIKQKALQMKLEKQRLIKEIIDQKEKEKAEEERKQQEMGIDWGMGEDAEDEPDLTDNPYASTANEELYLDDPKKTLRGYFEREGEELQYNCEERGVGQFICRVVLPLDDASGRPVTAEVVHRGKKKDAVVACALEACRILDRAGLLRQAKHESRRRKARDWSADDFYDSDEDAYLDRTGTVERKRKRRMIRHGAAQGEDVQADKPLTYEDLLKQVSDLESKIAIEEKGLETLRASEKQSKDQSWEDIDDLEQFMLSLGSQRQSMARKAEISNAKMNIKKLQAELAKTQKLAEIARPAHMPPLIKKDDKKPLVKVTSNSVIYGKRIRLKHDEEKRKREKTRISEQKEEVGDFEEEVDSDEELKLMLQEINTPRLNMIVEASKQDTSFTDERQHNVAIDSKQNENVNFQENPKGFTKVERSETKKEINFCTNEYLQKTDGKDSDTKREKSVQDTKVFYGFSTAEDIIECYREKGKNIEDVQNKKGSFESGKHNSEEKIKHSVHTKKENRREENRKAEHRKEKSRKEEHRDVEKKEIEEYKQYKQYKHYKRVSFAENSKTVENKTHVSEETSTKKESKKEFERDNKESKKELEKDKKDKSDDKHKKGKSSERSKTKEKKRHKSEGSSTKGENKKEIVSEKDFKDKHNRKESSERSETTEKNRKDHKENKSRENEKGNDRKPKEKSEYKKKESSSGKSKEEDKRKHSKNIESNEFADAQNTDKSEDKHISKKSFSEKPKTEERRKHDKHKHPSKRENKIEDDVENRENSEDRHKRKESSSEKSNEEEKRKYPVEQDEVSVEERKIVEDEQIKKETSEPEDINKQNIKENLKKEDNEVNNDSEQNDNIVQKEDEATKVYGPMRPPENYVIPEDYFEQCTDRDLPEITEKKVIDGV